MAQFMDMCNDGVDDSSDSEEEEEKKEENKLKDLKRIYYKPNVNKVELLTYTNKGAKATALHLAANNGHDDIVEFLVEKIKEELPGRQKELINKQNKYFFTPLMSVCFRGFLVKG